MLFPTPREQATTPASHPLADTDRRTALLLVNDEDRLPLVQWVGPLGDLAAGSGQPPELPVGYPASALLPEHYRGGFTRPGLRGHREPGAGDTDAGWSSAFKTQSIEIVEDRLTVRAVDNSAALSLITEVDSLPGGSLRVRHLVRNDGVSRYLLDGLDVVVPVVDSHTEVLDFTGRHERERSPQRHALTDGLWLREEREGRTGLDTAMLVAVGTPGFDFTHGQALLAHVGHSGNSVLRVECSPRCGTTVGGGELILPGEIALSPGESYASPWVYLVATSRGLDQAAYAWHTWQRSLPAHPSTSLSTLNVWEAVYFDHGLPRLLQLADLAAEVGVERFVLDDGWFHRRRDDSAGLGDWWVDSSVWPQGLSPLVDRVRAHGMEFGLWFEPEMVNPDSDLYRAHPDWVLAAGGRVPMLRRNQLVLDLSRHEVMAYLIEHIDQVLGEYDIGFVKWDHNRELLDAGSGARGGTPSVHAQTQAYYELLDELARRHPGVTWESCASGGGRIDLGVIERVQRFWASDMTDALARQQIQRWTSLLVAPEYIGAHISAPTSHQTYRHIPLAFRAVTALFGAFGIEWDLTCASEQERAQVAWWVEQYKQLRPILHGGKVVRPTSADFAVQFNGVVADDRRTALVAHMQLEESTSDRGVWLRVPDLLAAQRYSASWVGDADRAAIGRGMALDERGPLSGATMSGAALSSIGIWLPRRRPMTATLMRLDAVD